MQMTEYADRTLQNVDSMNGSADGSRRIGRAAPREGAGRALPCDRDQPLLALLERVPQGVVVLDHEGRVLSCNERFAAMTGFPSLMLRDALLDSHLPPREAVAFRALRLGDHGDGGCGDFKLRRVDGSMVPVRIAVSALPAGETGIEYVGAVVTDLRGERDARARWAVETDRLSHEVERRQRVEERFGRALVASGMASWELDLESGRTLHAMGMDRLFAAAEATAWSVPAVVAAFVPSDRDAIANAFDEASLVGSIDVEGRVALSGAAERRIRIEGRLLPDAPHILAAFASDVTAAHDARERLRHAAQMESVGQMAAGIAHDLNNFLQVIGNGLELVARKTAGDAQITRLSGAAQRALLRAVKLSQQLLAFARGQEMQLERVSLDEVVPSIRTLLDRVLPESIGLHIQSADEVWPCATDPCRLEAALLNLAINARDAMPDGGVLGLTVENRGVGAACAASWGVMEGDYVMVRVSDSGTGMLPEVAARAFEPFFTTKPPGKGTGLGLSQVYAFAKRSGGFVTIETAVGRGTHVLLFLPRHP